MNESTFLAQLEQRTEQVKITLANLEAERTRIEGAIAQLQPLVPHYDALISAERAIEQAQIKLDATSAQQASSGQEEHRERHEQEPSGGESADWGEQHQVSGEPHTWGEQAEPEQRGGGEQGWGEHQPEEHNEQPSW